MTGLLLRLMLVCAAPLAAGKQGADEQEDYVNLMSAPVSNITPELGVPTDSPEFAGNPAANLFSWMPEDLVLAPIPGYNPQFGWSLAAVAGYFMDLDKKHPDAPPSVVGAVGWFADNGSWAAGLGGRFHLLDDKIRLSIGGGYGDVNYRFYGIGDDAGDRGISVRIGQEVPAAYGSFEYELFRDFYLGLGYLYTQVNTSLKLEFDLLPPDFPALEIDSNIAGVSVPLEFDTRDDLVYPRSGWFVSGRALLYRSEVGSDVETETVSLAINRYIPIRKRDVLALRLKTRATGDGAPFYLLSTFGGSTDLRGYVGGRYRDRMMYALQGEYRWQPHDSWIFTGFAGFGEVAPSYSEFFSNLLPAGGIGARFVLSKKHKVSLSFDVAVGKHGAEIYFGVGEAF